MGIDDHTAAQPLDCLDIPEVRPLGFVQHPTDWNGWYDQRRRLLLLQDSVLTCLDSVDRYPNTFGGWEGVFLSNCWPLSRSRVQDDPSKQ